MAGVRALQKIQLGREATAGTAVAATTIWRGAGAALEDTREVTHPDEIIGIATNSNRAYVPKVEGALSLDETPATFEQLPHILEAGVKTVSGVADGSGSSGYTYTYPVSTTAINSIKTYTIESGDNQQAEEMEYSFVTDFTLSGTQGEAVMMEANWIGRQAQPVSFTGALSAPSVEEILAQLGTLYIDDAGGTIGSTAVSDTLLEWSLSVTTGYRAKYTLDGAQKYFAFSYFDKDSFEATLELTYEHNATGVAEVADFRANTGRLIRLELTGTAYATAGSGTTFSGKKGLRIDCAGIYTEFGALDNSDGNNIRVGTLRIGYDSDLTKSLEILVANELSALP